MTTAPTQATATEFVEFFTAGWELGARDAEDFFRHFGPRMHPDTVLIQPIAAPARGPGALRELFGPLFKAIPDLTGTLRRWGQTDDGVFIELTLRGHLGSRPVEWTVVDRIILEDGKIRERRSYFDPAPLLKAVALRPRASLPLLLSLFRR
ncbi:nuclear transport factor 2 family protein [Mycolicibacterium moriokaense]|uniref:Ketosteroid isomerase-like protein n=1 Tax=Mycolicibacterium moriokaense TaxID=39691 RepID=A0A318HSC5_9MYCO|nr:nuclear transport factor 2 family protein [Mycolicibacterium moriokaense]PXX07776.1 ketosteroid isomerase-like protein [Mycolicibacterium moriokaense]